MKLRVLVLCAVCLFAPLRNAAAAMPPLFAGLRGTFALPIVLTEASAATVMSSVGGGGGAEFGIQLGKFQLAVDAAYAGTGSKSHIIQSFHTGLVGGHAFYVLDKDLIPFFPNFLAIRPGVGIAAKLYSGAVFRTESLRARGLSDPVNGVTPEYSVFFISGFSGAFTGGAPFIRPLHILRSIFCRRQARLSVLATAWAGDADVFLIIQKAYISN